MFGAAEEQAQFLVEDEERRAFAASRRLDDELLYEQRFAGSRRPQDQSAGAPLDAPTQERVEFFDAASQQFPTEAGLVLGRDQTGKDLDPAALDREIMVAAPERLPPVLDHPQPAALCPIVRRQFFKPD